MNHAVLPYNNVAVVGLGYIGLPTAAVLASRKIPVIGIDICQKTVNTINRGEIHIVEPSLDIIVHAAVTEGYLRATLAAEPADVFLIAVPTPFKEGNEPDLSYIHAASLSIAPVLKKGDLVILESTSPVGATEKMAQWLAHERPDLSFPQDQADQSDIRIAYCPERVLPGHVLRELVENDRVIGGMTPSCSQAAIALYRLFVEGECITTDCRTAELCKLTENSFRDVNIAFANELSLICDKLEINVWELIHLANRHPRVNILQPGPGVGGHCIAVDPWFIVNKNPNEARLIRKAREVNDSKPAWVLDKVKEAIASCLKKNPQKKSHEITITCCGLTFKADIDDLRESPALAITHAIVNMHPGPVMVVEPHIENLPAILEKKAMLYPLDEALLETDVLVFLVNHKVFQRLSKTLHEQYLIVDASGIWAADYA